MQGFVAHLEQQPLLRLQCLGFGRRDAKHHGIEHDEVALQERPISHSTPRVGREASSLQHIWVPARERDFGASIASAARHTFQVTSGRALFRSRETQRRRRKALDRHLVSLLRPDKFETARGVAFFDGHRNRGLFDLRRKVLCEAPNRRMVKQCCGLQSRAEIMPEARYQIHGADGVEACAHERRVGGNPCSDEICHCFFDNFLDISSGHPSNRSR